METGSRRGSAPKSGSVWETRMKLDQIKGGVKILDQTPTKGNAKQSPPVGGSTGRRKTWKSDNIQIASQRSESAKNLDQLFKETTAKPHPSIGRSVEDEDKRPISTVDLGVEVEVEVLTKTRHKPDNTNTTTTTTTTTTVVDEVPNPISPLVTSRLPNDFSGTRTNTNTNTNTKLQSFVDLIMWRDVSRSAFVFGVGLFAIVSSSFTKDLNISFISVISYFGLLYLAANFLFKSLANRVSMPSDSDRVYVVGEDEAIWVVKLLLPYVNEFQVKLRALFCGDPATTMKLAVLLFILAQCGNSITIWKVAKLGFIGVFTVPKVCCSYAAHITTYVTFWVRRFKDAWKSCSHKKVVGFATFTLIWNLSSIVARVWMVFMLLVALKYYQQSIIRSDDWTGQETLSTESSWGQGKYNGRQQAEFEKQKKVC